MFRLATDFLEVFIKMPSASTITANTTTSTNIPAVTPAISGVMFFSLPKGFVVPSPAGEWPSGLLRSVVVGWSRIAVLVAGLLVLVGSVAGLVVRGMVGLEVKELGRVLKGIGGGVLERTAVEVT